MDADHAPDSERPVFRAHKRRKVYRRRESNPEENSLHDGNNPSDAWNNSDGESSSRLAEALRKARMKKRRRGSLTPSSHKSTANKAEDENSGAVVNTEMMLHGKYPHLKPKEDKTMLNPEDGSEIKLPNFKPAYKEDNTRRLRTVDNFLASRKDLRTADPAWLLGEMHRQAEMERVKRASLLPPQPPRRKDLEFNSVSGHGGHLCEIDLGPEVKAQNIARTKAAVERMEKGLPAYSETESEDDADDARTEEDKARDKRVEAFFKENPMHVKMFSDMPDSSIEPHERVPGKSNDDILYEKFRNDYMEQVAEKRATKRANMAYQKSMGSGKEKQSKGPKLGGSRSQRAAVHAQRMEQGGR